MFNVYFIFVVALTAAQIYMCQTGTAKVCTLPINLDLNHCNARYGDIEVTEFDLQSFANKQIAHSFQYLLMASHFNNYERNRKGFGKLYRNLSDENWNNAIDLIKYITKRGGRMNFDSFKRNDKLGLHAMKNEKFYELYELESLAKALDIQKSLAEEANEIYLTASSDSETLSHLEKKYVHPLASSIRDLAGLTSVLKNLMSPFKANSLNLFLFDDILQKLY